MPDWSIITLLGSITVASIAITLKFAGDLATAQRARDDALKDLEKVRAENAALQKIVDEHKAQVSGRVPKTLNYPNLNLA